jgi:anaerobic selenocysteine-containing dehydrogenase
VLAGLAVEGSDVEAVHIAPPDSYSLRLVAARRLYDRGRAVAASPSLSALSPAAVVCANPYDLDRLGAGSGDRVRVRSARGSLVLPAQPDAGVPRGVVAIDFNVSAAEGGEGPANAVSVLIDGAEPVVDVRLESV